MAKVQGSKLGKDRQAALLALADSIGDAKAAAKFGIRSARTVYNYRQSLLVDSELRELYEAAKARQEVVDDRVVEAQAQAEVEVWGAIGATARRIRDADEIPAPEYLEALARVIEATAKSNDQRADVELTRRMLEQGANGGERAAKTPAHSAPGRGVPQAGSGRGEPATLQ